MTFLGAFPDLAGGRARVGARHPGALFVTPVRHRRDILLAKLIPYFLVGMTGSSRCVFCGSPLLVRRAAVSAHSFSSALASTPLHAGGARHGASHLLGHEEPIPGKPGGTPADFSAGRLLLSGFLFDLHKRSDGRARDRGGPAGHSFSSRLIKTLLLAGHSARRSAASAQSPRGLCRGATGQRPRS